MSTSTSNTRHGEASPGALVMKQHHFLALMRQLERHSDHRREAGAFLLAPADASDTTKLGRPQISLRHRALEGFRRGRPNGDTVTAVAYYKDLDPESLTGGITFHAIGYTRLSELCRNRDLKVLADIHLHPDDGIRQSSTDADHPMVACPGHLALIAPRLGAGVTAPTELGAHVMTKTGWESYFASDVADVFRVRRTLRGQAALLARHTWLSKKGRR